MKYFCVFNKVGTPCILFFHKNQSLGFGGLGKHLNRSLATEKPSFRQLKNWIQDYLNHRKIQKGKMVSASVTIGQRQHEEHHYQALNH